MNDPIHKVDHAALRVNQAAIITLLIAAFVVNVPWLVAGVALVMLIGTALRQPGFKPVYAGLLKPRGIVKPEVIEDNPQPHVFAQGMGGTVLLIALVGFWLGSAVIGWALTWLVVALAALNLFVGFCAGCFVYYWLSRLSVPGFIVHPPSGTFPGMRPSGKAS
jgi:MFS family permease